MVYSRQSSTPTTLASVEIVLFNFCLLESHCINPDTNYMQPPVWLFRSGCTPYVALTYVNNWMRMYAPMILLLSMFCFEYFNNCLNLAVSSLVLLATLVHRNNMAGSMFGLPLLLLMVIFKLQSVGCPHIFLVLWNSHQCF